MNHSDPLKYRGLKPYSPFFWGFCTGVSLPGLRFIADTGEVSSRAGAGSLPAPWRSITHKFSRLWGLHRADLGFALFSGSSCWWKWLHINSFSLHTVVNHSGSRNRCKKPSALRGAAHLLPGSLELKPELQGNKELCPFDAGTIKSAVKLWIDCAYLGNSLTSWNSWLAKPQVVMSYTETKAWLISYTETKA